MQELNQTPKNIFNNKLKKSMSTSDQTSESQETKAYKKQLENQLQILKDQFYFLKRKNEIERIQKLNTEMLMLVQTAITYKNNLFMEQEHLYDNLWLKESFKQTKIQILENLTKEDKKLI